MSSENVLRKLLKAKSEGEMIEKFFKPEESFKKLKKTPGRPKVADELKARNFTLCLAPQYLEFIDKMIVKNPKVQGRGRKIRFIIDRFIEHEKRSLGQLKVLRESLQQVQIHLQNFGGRVKKGERLKLSDKETESITKVVNQVHLILKILHYSPVTLRKILPREDWAILSFCLDWKNNRRVIL